MSTYPVLGYQVTLPAPVTLTVELGGTEDDVTVAAGTYWGWMAGSAPGSRAGTLAWAFAQALTTHSYWPTTPTVTMQFVADATTQHARPYWVARFFGGGLSLGEDLRIVASSSTLFDRACGVEPGDKWEIANTGYVIAERRWLGCWSPGSLASWPEPVYVDRGVSTRSDYDPSAHDRVRVGRSLLYMCEWDYVNAADITREVLAQSDGYLALAGREAGDIYGTLDDLLGAAGSNSEIRLVTTADDSDECILDAAADLQRNRFTTEESVGARRYRVTLPLMLASEYAGVET